MCLLVFLAKKIIQCFLAIWSHCHLCMFSDDSDPTGSSTWIIYYMSG
ncbi:hypothetical protein IMSAG192_00760 [Muribaculaceae bacterium]|nr:hypothetical protein IMSAG192_00760 [Muribaculaceae bacterium]